MDELPDLLKLRQPLKIRQGAADLVLGLTGDAASIKTLATDSAVISAVWDCLADKDKKLSVTAAQILVNLTSHSERLYTPSDDAIPSLILVFHNAEGAYLYNSIAMVLNNISRSTEQAERFSKLVFLADCQLFIKHVSRGAEQGYLAAVLGNLALSEVGRTILSDSALLSELVSLLVMPGNLIVRRNIARLLRNLSFDVKFHPKLVEHLPQIVYPLCGGEEIDEEDMDKLPLDLQYLPEDKEREHDLQTRILISDTLFQMGGTYSVREAYRAGNYYPLLKNYDQWEENLDAREHIQNVIYIIIQDDGEVDLRKEDELPAGCEDEAKVEVVKLPATEEADLTSAGS